MRHAKVSTIADASDANLVRPSNWNAGHILDVTTVSTTTYTLGSIDDGTVLKFTHASGCTVTCPNSFSAGFNVGLLQTTSGQVTCVAASGATIINRQSFTKTAGQWATASLLVDANSNGTSAHYVLGGDCA